MDPPMAFFRTIGGASAHAEEEDQVAIGQILTDAKCSLDTMSYVDFDTTVQGKLGFGVS